MEVEVERAEGVLNSVCCGRDSYCLDWDWRYRIMIGFLIRRYAVAVLLGVVSAAWISGLIHRCPIIVILGTSLVKVKSVSIDKVRLGDGSILRR